MELRWFDRARALMRQSGITYEKLADDLDVSTALIGHWLTGRRDPKLKQIKQIANALEVTLKDLIGDDAIILSKDKEVTLMEIYRNLPEKEQETLISLAKALTEEK